MTKRTADPHEVEAAKLASEHVARVLAGALLLRLTTDGKKELAGKLLSLLAGELGDLHSSLFPTPELPG
jgi:hypothetical protein